jgi:hypothetical protein
MATQKWNRNEALRRHSSIIEGQTIAAGAIQVVTDLTSKKRDCRDGDQRQQADQQSIFDQSLAIFFQKETCHHSTHPQQLNTPTVMFPSWPDEDVISIFIGGNAGESANKVCCEAQHSGVWVKTGFETRPVSAIITKQPLLPATLSITSDVGPHLASS